MRPLPNSSSDPLLLMMASKLTGSSGITSAGFGVIAAVNCTVNRLAVGVVWVALSATHLLTVAAHTPAWQASSEVQGSASSQATPLALGTGVQAPLRASQVPTS